MAALYRCLKCVFRWQGAPGPSDCPSCGHKYVAWENYEDWRRAARPRSH